MCTYCAGDGTPDHLQAVEGSTLELEPSSGVVTFKRLSHGNLLQQPQDSDKICISRSVRGANNTAPDRGQQPHRGLDWCHYTQASHCLEEKPWLLQRLECHEMPRGGAFPTLPHPPGSALLSLAYFLFGSFIYRKLLSPSENPAT